MASIQPESPRNLCKMCGNSKRPKEFKQKNTGLSATCLTCLQRATEKRNSKKGDAPKENYRPTNVEDRVENEESTETDFNGLSALPLDQFLQAISATGINSLTARVKVDDLVGNVRECADELSAQIWDKLQYRFKYVPFTIPIGGHSIFQISQQI